MTFEQVSWNVKHISKKIENGLSENEFVRTSLLEGHYKRFCEADQIEILTEVYYLIKNGYGRIGNASNAEGS